MGTGDPPHEGVFIHVQDLWGFVSAPTCAVFAVGLWRPQAPAAAARCALLAGPLLYLASRAPSWIWTAEEAEAAGAFAASLHAYASLSFLYHMFIPCLVFVGLMLAIEWRAPREAAWQLPDRAAVDLAPHPYAKPLGGAVLAATASLYVVFW